MGRGLFDPDAEEIRRTAPLAERMRPRTLDEIVGQPELAAGSPLRRLLAANKVPSLILWGPPGCGKTSAARLVGAAGGREVASLSAVSAGVKEIRAAIDAARLRRADGVRTLLFVDEIHHFNRSQQDALLPAVEDGTLALVGATTENPSFHLNGALHSRCLVAALRPLDASDLAELARRALADAERGLGRAGVALADDAVLLLARTSHGDARSLLLRLETLVEAAAAAGVGALDATAAARLLGVKRPAYDRAGDAHYDAFSALQKSVRGGDPQAALYYLVRMLDAGEPPLAIARRLVRIASEDVGLADPGALRVALDATEAYRFLGSPEGELALAEATTYLATAPKSASVYAAVAEVKDVLARGGVHDPPDHLRGAPTKLMERLGRGAGYKYPHDFDEAVADQEHLPAALRGATWYRPSPFGHEKEIARRMNWWDEVRRRLRDGAEQGAADA